MGYWPSVSRIYSCLRQGPRADSPDFSGVDTFTYFLRDDRADSPASTVTITILPVNDPPDAQPDSYLSDENAELDVAAPGLLENDTDIDSASLTAELLTPPANGTVLIQPDGSFTYIPAVNFRGPDQFVYSAVDAGGETASATVTISVTQPPTATNDVYLVDVDTPLLVSDTNEGLLINDHDAPENDELFAILAGGKKAEDGETALRREVARLRDTPVSAAELAEAKNEILTAALESRETAEGKGRTIASSVIIDRDQHAADRQLAAISKVTAADIQRVAAKYLRDERSATTRISVEERRFANVR